ncbi:hypothetical protein [Planctomyces sp. SH-PL14]|uniref:hypothetical protein n=1 Tax=Planctomyces sp. SH-PL14 TaxID=1632864 RepID=UPI00078B798C|nr:hypothetical protein [Planctomyces sp. SH-PL14]AMV18878.1 hypothetical protein VT03_13395 [Planctomyces sp. SH-PL14]
MTGFNREHFAELGLELANRPYPTPEGPEYYARLLWPDGSWKPKLTEHVGREFAISLERETFSHCGTMTRRRPLAELPAYLQTCGIPNRTSEAPERGISPLVGAVAQIQAADAVMEKFRKEQIHVLEMCRTSQASPPAAGEPSFLDECRSKGIEVNPFPLTAERLTFAATYRGKRFHVYPKSRSAMFGYRIPLGRRWESQTVDEALQAIDAELDGPVTPPAMFIPEPAPPAVDPPPRSIDCLYETRHSIERIGGRIAAGVHLQLLALTRPGHGNFARLDGQPVLSDVALERFREVSCV